MTDDANIAGKIDVTGMGLSGGMRDTNTSQAGETYVWNGTQYEFIITGVVLLIAASVDALTRLKTQSTER